MEPARTADYVATEIVAGPAPIVPSADQARRWIILALLAFGALIAFVDRTSISAALAVPAFKRQFGLTDVDRGLIGSSFYWSYAVLQIPMGWLVDRYGVKTPYTICFLLWCAASAGFGLVSTFGALIVMQMLIGAAESVVIPASYRWMRNNFREGSSGTAVGLYMLGTKLGTAVGAPVAAWLIVSFGWRSMFVIAGGVGLVWVLPWLGLVANDLPRGAVARATARRQASALPARVLLASPLVWGTMIVNFCYNYFTFYSITWMPSYLVERRHLSLTKMGLYSFFSFAGIALVALAAGAIADRLIQGGRNPVVVRKAFTICGFLIASTVVMGATATTLQAALFWNIASLSGLGLATANNLALCRLTLIPAPVVGLVTGFQQVATSLAGITAPLLSGWLLHVSGDYALPMRAIFVVLIVGALSCLFLLRADWAARLMPPPADAAIR